MGKITDGRLKDLKGNLEVTMLNSMELNRSAGKVTNIDFSLTEQLMFHLLDAQDVLEKITKKHYGEEKQDKTELLANELMAVIKKYKGGQ